MGVLCVCWVLLARRGWMYIVGIVTVLVLLAVVASKITAHYERIGLAVRIPRVVSVAFTGGTPVPIRTLRILFLALAVALLALGIWPVSLAIVKKWIITVIVAMFVVGLSHEFLVWHYLRTGRAASQFERRPAS